MAVQDVEVAYRGVEVGELEALLKTASPQYKSRSYSSALEDSAVAGESYMKGQHCNGPIHWMLWTCIHADDRLGARLSHQDVENIFCQGSDRGKSRLTLL